MWVVTDFSFDLRSPKYDAANQIAHIAKKIPMMVAWLSSNGIVDSESACNSNSIVHTSPLNDVTYFVSNSDGLCSAIDSLTIQVHEEVPVASFTADKHCDGDTLVFMANSGLLTLNK